MNFSQYFSPSVFAIFLLLSSASFLCCESLHNVLFSMSDDNEEAAIKTIHKQLDDNADGNVDFSESEEVDERSSGVHLMSWPPDRKWLLKLTQEFPGNSIATRFVQELCDPEEKKLVCTGSEKSRKFHQKDKRITSSELWATWQKNEGTVFSWTTSDVLEWLEHSVKLPQYANTFKKHKITGRDLPYIAINSGQILQTTLLITDGQHKQKVQLRAMDVILFGPPAHHGHFWKDIILVICMACCVSGIVFAMRQRRLFQSRMDSFIADLRLKEEEVRRLKTRFEELETEREDVQDGRTKEVRGDEEDPPIMMVPAEGHHSPSSVDEYSCKTCTPQPQDIDSVISLAQAQDRIDVLQDTVWSLEREVESKEKVLQMLRQVLPDCQHKERQHLEFRKALGEEQIARAQRACEKIRKRRSSIFGTFHLANSSALEEAGLQITKAVNKMQYISECFEEHHKRWSKIGQMTGFPHSPRDTISVDQPPHTAFPLPSRRYSVRLPDAGGLSTFSIASSIGARSFRQSRYRTSSSSISNGSRSSDPFISSNQLTLPSLKERDTEYGQAMDKDSAFSSSSSSAPSFASSGPQSSGGARSSTGSHSSSGSHSSNSFQSTEELSKDPDEVPDTLDDPSDGLSRTGFKMRGRDRRKRIIVKSDSVPQPMRDSGSEEATDSSTNSLPVGAKGSVRSLAKLSSVSSDV